MMDPVEKKLDEWEKNGIAKKVEKSDRASPLVVVPMANGDIRSCGDYKVTINRR